MDVEVENNSDKATTLLQSFFPPVPAGWKEDEVREDVPKLDDPDITADEITQALKRVSPYKAPGIDGIPNMAGKKRWEPIRQRVTDILARL